jgi:hypothetical protein
MATVTDKKLKKLLDLCPKGHVCLSSWLNENKISYDLQQYYRRAGWLESLGQGAYKRQGNPVDWKAALSALQNQSAHKAHVGALTALSLQGYSHYLRMGGERVYLFTPTGGSLPKWFRDRDWGQDVHLSGTGFLPAEMGITESTQGDLRLKISDPERAILECLYLSPDNLDLVECYHLMEGLANLRPRLLQELLEECKSIKVKRLFLYLAGKAGHQWFKFFDPAKVETGTGDRAIVKGGVYVPEYKISVPRELAEL